jgi:hypothetical protein
VRLDGTSTVFRGNSIENWLFWSTDYYDDQGELVGGEWGWCQAAGPSLTVSGRASVLRNQIDYTGTTGAIRITGNGTIRDNDLRMSNEYDEESGFGPTFQHSVIDVLGIATIQRNEILGSPSPNSGHAGVAINIHGAPGSIVGAQNSTVAGQGNVIDSPIEGREFRATGIRVASGRTRVGGNHIGNVEGVGILAESGSDGSSFFENAVMGGYPPCRDETSGYRTAGTANRWYANATNADPDSNASEPPGICPPANSP